MTLKIPPFIRPKFSLKASTDLGSLSSLPDLVEFNAIHNSLHPFCIQHYGQQHLHITVSCRDLYHGVLRCSLWLALRGLAQLPRITQDGIVKARPVAILMSSDVGWFIAFLALLRLGVPVLCLSTRLAPQAVVNLLHATHAQAILVSPQLDTLSQESVCLFTKQYGESEPPSVHLVPPFTKFLDPRNDLDPHNAPLPPRFADVGRDAVIMHSSGSTGLPKPIFHSNGYLLGYAACHRLSARDSEGAINVSTLPLYHVRPGCHYCSTYCSCQFQLSQGFGLLAPCLSLAVGMPFVLPSPNTIPTGLSTLDILMASNATSLMTVPSILEELYLLPDCAGTNTLKNLRFVAVGGAPMKQSVAKSLVHAGVPILNHWGATELGAIAPIFIPDAEYDWRYLRVRDDMGLRFEPVEDDNGDVNHYRLMGCPPGTNDEFIVQDLLEVNPRNPSTEFRIAGRADDLIVLATGEKVRPTRLEQHVSEHPLVRGAIVFGDGKFQLGLIIEVSPSHALDLSNPREVGEYIDVIWSSVQQGNEETDRHGRVEREMIIVTTDDTVPLIRTPKGSIPRGDNTRLFQEKIDELYARAGVEGAEALPVDDHHRFRDATDSDDFFERGMDSLQATMLRRRLNGAMALTTSLAPSTLPLDIVYANPSVELLCNALLSLYHDSKIQGSELLTLRDRRLDEIRQTMETWVQKVADISASTSAALQGPSSESSSPYPSSSEGAVVLLTGSTGSLGSALLHVLASSPHVTKIHALNRRGGSMDVRCRQEEGLRKLGVHWNGEKSENLWHKVELHEVDFSAIRFGLDNAAYSRLQTVTHIIHNAWPMDFNRSLKSFHPHLDASLNIIKLALDTHHARPVRVLFSSSIAVVGRYPLIANAPSFESAIPENTLDDPAGIDHFGYAEAKWVCERMFEEASSLYSDKMVATSVRIGQMTGTEGTGAWNVAEHVPMIVQSCVAVGKVPKLEGTASWIPVNKAAVIMSEFLFASETPSTPVLHLENPVRQSWSRILDVLSSRLALPSSSSSPIATTAEEPERIPFTEWLQLVEKYSHPSENPCVKIIPFLEEEFIRMSTGHVVLDMTASREVSRTLNGLREVTDDVLVRYVDYWRGVWGHNCVN
ncbi:hypothetical protein BDY19DRAFT_740627 [Irpex rosettiformis]|uniref:Uncharacterized protein n=1 Tax=Irpex rosettiformis TaxID=378272 RepID=A0ACB8U9I1_9APHY|nr:hypothetical protein BDY19DRAFT_740627 [Irpex rosettiformis]